jgi:hypothetical protein
MPVPLTESEPNLGSPVRTIIGLRAHQSHRIVAIFAMDGISAHRPRWQWAHVQLAALLRVDTGFLRLTEGYLHWRAQQQRSQARALRPNESLTACHLMDVSRPDDLHGRIPLLGETEAVRLADLFGQACQRNLGVWHPACERAEKVIGTFCGTPFEAMAESYRATRREIGPGSRLPPA